jgi:hypothetical protein
VPEERHRVYRTAGSDRRTKRGGQSEEHLGAVHESRGAEEYGSGSLKAKLQTGVRCARTSRMSSSCYEGGVPIRTP